MRIFLAILLCIFVISCDTADHRLPAVGQVIYCPHCDSNLYQRVSGTSRTAFKRSEYIQCRYDMPVPAVGEETVCPMCHKVIVEERGGLLHTFYRDKQ